MVFKKLAHKTQEAYVAIVRQAGEQSSPTLIETTNKGTWQVERDLESILSCGQQLAQEKVQKRAWPETHHQILPATIERVGLWTLAYLQLKTKIEELLELGYIHPFTSSYRAPVLFAKKKR